MYERFKLSKCCIGKIQISLSTILLFLFSAIIDISIVISVNHANWANICIIIALFTALIAAISMFFFEDKNICELFQWFIIIAVFFLFFLLSIKNSKLDIKSIPYRFPFAVSTVFLLGVMLVFLVVTFFCFLARTKISPIIGVDTLIFPITIIVLCVLLYYPCFSYLFKSDSYVYYETAVTNVGNWRWALDTLADIELGYHKCYGYSLFIFLGIYIFKNPVLGCRMVHLFFYITSSVFLYYIIKKECKKLCEYVAFLATIIFMVSPFILGTIQELSLDFPTVCVFIWVLYFYMYNYKYLFVFSTYIFVFTKENNILYFGGFAIGIVAFRLVKKLQKKEELTTPIIRKDELAAGFSVVLFVLTQKLGNDWGQFDVEKTFEVGLLNCFQINPFYIGIKVKQMLFLNFNWILIFIIVGLWILNIKRRVEISDIDAGIIGLTICLVVFNLFYFTYPHSRYIQIEELVLVYFLAKGLNTINIKMQYFINLFCIVITLIQTFQQVDFLSNKLFPTRNVGDGEIISLAYYGNKPNINYIVLQNEEQGANLSGEVLRDYVQTNRTYERLETLLERVFAEIHYSSCDTILISPIFTETGHSDIEWTAANVFGVTSLDIIFWDKSRRQFTYDNSKEKINWGDPRNIQDVQDGGNIWYIFLPLGNENYNDYLNEKYSVCEHVDYYNNPFRIELLKVEK